MTQGNFAQLAVDAVGWPVAPGVTARVPASYTYSVNGSASAAVPAGKVDITALLYSGTTKRPLARLNSVDLWAAPETYSMQAPNSALGGSQPTLFALGATFYIDANMIPGNNLGLYNGSYVRTKALEHVWITITGSAWVMDPTPFTYSSVTYYRYFISATDGTDTGLFYAFCVYRPGGVPTSMGPEAPVMGVASAGYYGYRNDRFDATVTMRVTNKYIAQAN